MSIDSFRHLQKKKNTIAVMQTVCAWTPKQFIFYIGDQYRPKIQKVYIIKTLEQVVKIKMPIVCMHCITNLSFQYNLKFVKASTVLLYTASKHENNSYVSVSISIFKIY